MRPTSDLNVVDTQLLRTPDGLKADLPISAQAAELVYRTREEIRAVLRGRDSRLLVVVGPCSVHDPEAAIDYAGRLQALRRRYEDELLLVMRVYFEKPRTTVGWKGLVNDPHLNGSHDIGAGLRIARDLLVAWQTRACLRRRRFSTRSSRSTWRTSCRWAADRRAHHREPDAPRDGQRPLDARRLQERDRRGSRGGDPRARRCVAPAQFPGHRRRGAGRDRPHGRATRTAISSSAAATRARTTRRSTSRRQRRRSRRPASSRACSSTAATTTAARATSSSRT